jgi:glycosyltransferase involved in cell wall biosynthesis
MIIHLFNSSLVSGPETLVIPALPELSRELGEIEVGNLAEIRKGARAQAPLEYARSFGLKTFEIPVRSRIDPSAIRELARTLEQKQPQIVHAHDVKASIYLALANRLLAFSRPKSISWKSISTHHGVHARNGAAIRLYELLYSFLFLRSFHAVLCVCSSDRDILIRRGIPAERVHVHLNGVDRKEITPQARPALQSEIRNQWSSELGVDLNGKHVIGVAARLSPEKNHALLLDSLSQLRQKAPSLQWICLCFGVGALEAELRRKTQALGLEQHVHWAGYRQDLSKEMAGLDLLLSLSTGEGLPINLLEAGWSATPILATAVDGVADLLPEDSRSNSSGKSLTLSRLNTHPTPDQVAERLAFLLSQADWFKNSGEALQQRVKNSFSGNAWKSRLAEIYRLVR